MTRKDIIDADDYSKEDWIAVSGERFPPFVLDFIGSILWLIVKDTDHCRNPELSATERYYNAYDAIFGQDDLDENGRPESQDFRLLYEMHQLYSSGKCKSIREAADKITKTVPLKENGQPEGEHSFDALRARLQRKYKDFKSGISTQKILESEYGKELHEKQKALIAFMNEHWW